MKKRYILLLLLLAMLLFFVINTLHQAGVFRDLEPHLEGSVQTVYTNTPGPEDIDIDRENGLLFISSTDRRSNSEPHSDGIYILSLDSVSTPKLLPTDYSGDFHPHGISFLKIDTVSYLHVVNHNMDGDFIELFEYRDDRLHHLRSYRDPEDMCCPNDVIGVSKETFYVTNDHGSREGFQRTLEEYLRLSKSNFMYYNGTSFSEAGGSMKMANGINISNDGTLLYATHTLGQELLTFQRTAENGKLQLISRTNLSSGVDNIDVDVDGNLWIGSHPKIFDFIAHARDPNKISPSQIFKLTPDEEVGKYQISEIYLDDGAEISGSSVAVRYKNELFVGCVFEPKVLRIQLN